MDAATASQLRAMGFKPEQIAKATVRGGQPSAPKRLAVPKPRRDLADDFAALWKNLGPKEFPLVREYRFAPPRRWRFDASWPEHKLAVELEGGIWTRGGHSRGRGMRRDMEKYNRALQLGWRLLRFCHNDLEQSPVQVIEQVASLLRGDSDAGESDGG